MPDEILGRSVVSSNGEHLGKVEDLDIDVSQWKIAALNVKLPGEVIDQLKLKDFVHKDRINISTREISSISDTVILTWPKNELRKAIESGRVTTLPST
jgi:sporulation protein YlmC with PRC-barrel domain